MKKLLILLSMYALTAMSIKANGVIFNKSVTGSYLTLTESSVNVSIESQVANTMASQMFINTITDTLTIKYAFPLPENASATMLRYKINGNWYTANFAPVPQDTTTGGSTGETDYNLNQYLGKYPIFFDIDQKLLRDSVILVELTYVELLNYKFGKVKYTYPNNYASIQITAIARQSFDFILNSERTISSIDLIGHTATNINNDGNQAVINYTEYEVTADKDFNVQYSLSLDELGLYSLSTYLPDTIQKDSYGRGFFAFIVEPDPSENTSVIDKVFTLIVDRSGSMMGEKMTQAKDAAKFIVENLNDGDKFNIVSFTTDVSSFREGHVEFNIENKNDAIDYINTLDATELTNISGAFDMAVPQFQTAGSSTANIIIFITDGEQTTGIINTDELINHINNLIVASETRISLFTFGIGSSTNERLLTTIANNNNGMAEFLLNNQLEEVITDFYLMIRNPVLLNTEIEFSPSIIKEIYPSALPNLYKGQQMILVGRYDEPTQLSTSLKGNAFSEDVEYKYSTQLSDTANNKYQFLTKLWAKSKIDDLLNNYYLNLDNTEVSDSIKEVIIDISINYGVISPFTSFHGGENDPNSNLLHIEESSGCICLKHEVMSNEYLTIESILPNPCKDHVDIYIIPKTISEGTIIFKLIDSQGRLIYSNDDKMNGTNQQRFSLDFKGLNLKSGVYLILIEFKDKVLAYKIMVN